jgi:metal-responsive CopG/Arc/MetJ family transcriptional regulator
MLLQAHQGTNMSKEKEGFKLIGFYAPDAILQKIAEVARKELCSKSDVCRKAVVSYLEEAARNQTQ